MQVENPDNLFSLLDLLFIKEKSVQGQWIATYWTAVTNSDSFPITEEKDICKKQTTKQAKMQINDSSSKR